ncbi:kinase-like domain-containing protein [Hygrophoropsis aurantiaca]|uniref:Kinase-like domain-containing protein n=1 Tax=Hygrophoropsis aurantiaca TaxID=72124 RepID=A0ACB7ZRW1_9AGAM|nr:kinase-like domain-containing protein [Hygrophoropsis aurantiaca]
MRPPPPPGVQIDLDWFDISQLDTIKSPKILCELRNAGKIGFVDYMRAICFLRATPTPLDLDSIKVLYPEASDPIISPAAVLGLLKSPPSALRLEQGTASVRTYKISDTMLVKAGSFREARTMLFIKEHTNIPVPTIHLVFVTGEREKEETYIVMEYISGGDLQHQWENLAKSERSAVVSQLKQYLHELRTITPPSQTPGPIDGGRCRGHWFSELDGGPFESHAQLVAWWNERLEKTFSRNRDPERDSEVKESDLLRADHPLVFTHGDLLPRNLILCFGTLWIVDWELAGWYPWYLEYVSIADDCGNPEYPTPMDWASAVLPGLPNFDREYAALKRVRSEIVLVPFGKHPC